MIFALLIVGVLTGLGLLPQKKKPTKGDRVFQPISNTARKAYRVQNVWKTSGTFAKRQTGPSQPAASGPHQSARSFSDEVNNLNIRQQSTSNPEWKMRFGRAFQRMTAQLARTQGKSPQQIPDRLSARVSQNNGQQGPASDWTRSAATYQKRFTHPGMLEGQPISRSSKGIGRANRKVNRAENPARVRTVRGTWPQVKYT